MYCNLEFNGVVNLDKLESLSQTSYIMVTMKLKLCAYACQLLFRLSTMFAKIIIIIIIKSTLLPGMVGVLTMSPYCGLQSYGELQPVFALMPE